MLHSVVVYVLSRILLDQDAGRLAETTRCRCCYRCMAHGHRFVHIIACLPQNATHTQFQQYACTFLPRPPPVGDAGGIIVRALSLLR